MIDELKAAEMYQRREVLKGLQKRSKDSLINEIYNRYVSSYADGNDDSPHGKAIPYIGWFWRDCDFIEKQITIGDCGEFIGIMENNKWDYPERLMTEGEVNTFIELIERVMAVNHGAGDDMAFYRKKRLGDLWNWMQTLKV